MGAICYTLLENQNELTDFDCGNESINKLVSDSFYPHILKQRQVHKLSYAGYRVGFYSVSVAGISLEESDAPVADYYASTPSFAAIVLNYLAVDKIVQGNGIGSAALKHIIAEARALYAAWPVRLLILDALRSKLSWYLQHGFALLNQADMNGTSETVRMYLDLMPEEEKDIINELYYYE